MAEVLIVSIALIVVWFVLAVVVAIVVGRSFGRSTSDLLHPRRPLGESAVPLPIVVLPAQRGVRHAERRHAEAG